jgi:hypothetical protein
MQSDDDYDNDDGLPYREPEEIGGFELSDALGSLQFLGDDPYLNMQAFNLSVVDQFIMRLEYDTLRKLHREESTPAPEAMFLSAQSQMWIFAAYELLRTWRERAEEIIKLHRNGGLKHKIAHLEKDTGYFHPGRKTRSAQLRDVLADPSIIDKIKLNLRMIHILFARLAFIRVALAKHQVQGRRNSIAYAPGYGRINQWCGSLEYQLEVGRVILGTISRRDIADELRAISDRSKAPTDEEIASFDAFMKGPPDDGFPPNASEPISDEAGSE